MRIALLLIGLACVSGCATTTGDPRDPIEPFNRAVFEVNDSLDTVVFKPVAQGYQAVLPDLVRAGVKNFFANLADPWNAINQILQGKVEEGANDFMRFVVNSTFGLGGVIDIASQGGMPKHDEDFGQTLGVWGVQTGPYLVLPILGPSSVRDGVGRAVDTLGYLPWRGPDWVDMKHDVRWRNGLTGLDFVQTRANLLDASNVLEQAALDRYVFVRNAYFQRRHSQVHDGNPPPLHLDDHEADAAGR